MAQIWIGANTPLTNAVLSAVEARHSGFASGFNSAVARTGGLIATALASAILVAHAQVLESAFHGAMLVGAATAATASATAFLWLPSSQGDKTCWARRLVRTSTRSRSVFQRRFGSPCGI